MGGFYITQLFICHLQRASVLLGRVWITQIYDTEIIHENSLYLLSIFSLRRWFSSTNILHIIITLDMISLPVYNRSGKYHHMGNHHHHHHGASMGGCLFFPAVGHLSQCIDFFLYVTIYPEPAT